MQRLFFLVVLGILLLVVCTAQASATIRFAGPGGTSADPCANALKPCSLFTAADQAAPGTTIGAGDEVVVAPGAYSTAAGDLGPNGHITLPAEVDMHGQAGGPRPRIDFGTKGSELVVGSGSNVSDLELEGAGNVKDTLSVAGGTVEDVVVKSSANGFVCNVLSGTIRDSACLSIGAFRGAAIGAVIGGDGPTQSVHLRNVTAVASGELSLGLRYRVIGEIEAPTLEVDAIDVIAQGTAFDVVAEGLSSTEMPGSGGNVEVRLDHSDYATKLLFTEVGGTATISPTGPGTTNIEATPMLAEDGYHELPDSPTRDAGIADPLTGTLDVDGEARTIGPAIDIGADEFGEPSELILSCTPSSLQLGSSSKCEVTAADPTAPGTPLAGIVDFSSDRAGIFSPSRCALQTTAGRSSCQVAYMPTQAGTHRITASYRGDRDHASSQDTSPLEVAAPPPGTPAPPQPRRGSGAPETTLTRKPRARTTKRRAVFAFTTDQAGSSFECKLDRKPFKPCPSPFKRKVRPGRHTFEVRAVSPQGVGDPTPAVFRWRVR
jgi:hypothetical protein